MLMSKVINPQLVNRLLKSVTFRSLNEGHRQFATQQSQQNAFEYKVVDGFKIHKLDKGPSTVVKFNKDEVLKIYKNMVVIRCMETRADEMYKEKLIRGFCHLYVGQEAIAAGMKSALQEGDGVITSFRAHAWSYLMGIPVKRLMAELVGSHEGCTKGKGGSMHMYAPHYYGGQGIVGAQVPLGTGVAMANKYLEKPNVCVTCYGDGASNQGQVYESFNIAKLMNLPVIYVCESNRFGMGTASERSSASTHYYSRVDYIPGIWVNGMDALAVKEATRFSREWCTSGKGPIVLEMATYRYVGHSSRDPGTGVYRTKDDIEHIKHAQDAIVRLRKVLIASKAATEKEIKDVEAEAKAEVEESEKFARHIKLPPISEMFSDVYSTKVPNLAIRGLEMEDMHEV